MSDMRAMVSEVVSAVNAEASKEKSAETIEAAGMTGIFDSLPALKFGGLNFSDPLKGAAVAGVGDAVAGALSAFIPPMGNGGGINWSGFVSKVGTAWLVNTKQAKRFLGPGAVSFGTMFLLYDAVQEVFQVRPTVKNLLGDVLGKFGMGSGVVYKGSRAPAPAPPPSVVEQQVGRVVEDYYGQAFGGRS
tara:strand:+ start:760 stop:1326 length:567 start_codon:yes stop_codon:yes gene_type:complete